MQKFPNRIRELREERGLSQQQLADLCKTSNQQISRLELGQRRLPTVWMDRIAEALRCQPTDIIAAAAGSPRKRAMMDIFDRLDPEDQDRLIKMGTALAEPIMKTGTEK